MRINISEDALSKEVPIPQGEYWVVLNATASQIKLMRAGKDIQIPALRRRAKSRHKREMIRFYCGGGKLWTLEVSHPRSGDWVAFIEYSK